MVWGGFCGHLKSDLAFVDGKVMINSEVYTVQILDPYLIPFWHKLVKSMAGPLDPGRGGWRSQASKTCIKIRLKHEVEVLPWCLQ